MMRERGGALHLHTSGSSRCVPSTARLLSLWTLSLLAFLSLARGIGSVRSAISEKDRGGGGSSGYKSVSGVGGKESVVRGGELILSSRSKADREDFAILLDCDAQTLPTMLNFLLSMNKFFDIADLVDMTHVVCLDERACRIVSEIGLRIASKGIANAVRKGFNIMAQKVEPEKFMHPGNISYRGNWLDDVMLAREYALLDLLNQGKMVLRSDADTCFRENPFTFMSSARSDVAVTVQPLDPALENGFWAFDWSCPDFKKSKLELTLNNGVILADGRKKVVRRTYGLVVGAGLKLLYKQENGWAQRGFNAILHDEKLCLKPAKTGQKKLRGMTSRALRIVSMNVCSPCEGCADASNSVVSHANCLLSTHEKVMWLQQLSCWFVPPDWERVRRTGNAVEYLHHLKLKG